ncbi:Na+/H+ antiporter NhaA [Novosphingobium sp. FSY-8]|uniref:Na(+)/H(+) antiporter NhaA n=1 Tax=Novosphingobium ovatum TaxID=1908523 RepID=A0ABW9XDZ4_9SPHN|nr:Na+/H+ antiporter NhaA [Novosphingobium ovatum]NBC36764.1 Na+/H+ antiporter NhaA [Novosphingobium ovatum]
MLKYSVQIWGTLAARIKHWKAQDSSALAGVVLMAVAAAAIIMTNTAAGPVLQGVLDAPLTARPMPHLANLRDLIGNGLMAVFFLNVGLEIKREALIGNLSEPTQRRLPVLAAMAGMACPALVYLVVVRLGGGDTALMHGWAIPAATDIAFALGVMALLGRRVPASLRLFLLTVAVVDDLGAVVIIALGYTAHVDAGWLGAGAAVWMALLGLNALGVKRMWPYVLGAGVLWWCVLHSGVHATVAGVAAALTVPLGLDARKDSPLLRLEHRLAPISGYVIVPLFGLANAGVSMDAASIARLATGDGIVLPLAIGLGLALGKPIGVGLACWAARATGFAQWPSGANAGQIVGIGMLAGIGFTMSLFIGGLAFTPSPDQDNALRLGILAGSVVSGVAGALVLARATRQA